MYNIIDQNRSSNMSMMLQGTNSSAVVKVDCAKECPCGVPAIPVPDQWLEVMVTGGFKVWHIIFIIIAFVVTIVVVYCCFHRCRIPRTKQEIEADLMRTNLASKFRDYLQEFPNEPTTFIEALKKVQELEEKSSEQDDSVARKRMGWLKLKGKDRQDNSAKESQPQDAVEKDPAAIAEGGPTATEITTTSNQDEISASVPGGGNDKKTADDSSLLTKGPDRAEATMNEPTGLDFRILKPKIPGQDKSKTTRQNEPKQEAKMDLSNQAHVSKDKKIKNKDAKLVKTKGDPTQASDLASVDTVKKPIESEKQVSVKTLEVVATHSSTLNKPVRTRRRKDKPNLSRTKAAHVGSPNESIDQNQNQLNVPSSGLASHQHHHDRQHHSNGNKTKAVGNTDDSVLVDKKDRKSRVLKKEVISTREKSKTTKDSTMIQIEPMSKLDTNQSN